MSDKTIRQAVRAILTESFDDEANSIYAKHVTDGPPRNQSDKDEFEFPVWDSEDREYMVSAVYNRRSPFMMELWKAVDTMTGEEVDVDELEMIVPDLQDRAFDFVARKHS
jgi:hypothetical protein